MERPEKIRYTKPNTNSNRNDWYNTFQWQRLRNMYRRRNPLCEECGEAGEMVHHVKPLNQFNVWNTERGKYGSPTDIRNLQTLCNKCHRDKHPHRMPYSEM